MVIGRFAIILYFTFPPYFSLHIAQNMDPKEQQEFLDRLMKEIQEDVKKIETLVGRYGSFNVIANSIARNGVQLQNSVHKGTQEPLPVTPEYVALICLKSPYSLGIGEFTNAPGAPKDFHEIDQLATRIVTKYSLVNHGKYEAYDKEGNFSDVKFFAQSMTSEELMVRNDSFESHHWDLLEDLYSRYDDYFMEKFGFTVNNAIWICTAIADYMSEQIYASAKKARDSSQQMFEEIKAWKYRGKKPKNFYTDEHLASYKNADDSELKWHFEKAMMTYEMVMMGHNLSFTASDIAEMEEDSDEKIIEAFLSRMSIKFGAVDPDFSKPELIHPLKATPLIKHDDRYICPSLSLLDYSLDRLFADELFRDNKKREKYKENRHEYLLEKGMEYLCGVLQPEIFHTNLRYENDEGEMDGIIICDNNVLFIEAKGHRITDRAKNGYIDRIEHHIDEIVSASHSQALRSYNYLFGKKDVVFKRKNGQKVIIDGSKFRHAYFISLTIESLRAVSCNLKIGNSLGLFTKETFPWLVCLYDLRVVCEHMEGPAYLLQYMHRRKEFFKLQKFLINDEIDLLGYYLKQNLRFDQWEKDERYQRSTIIHLTTMMPEFNSYYFYEQGITKKPVQKMKHYTAHAIKSLVAELEKSNLSNRLQAGIQLLELGTTTKKEFVQYIEKLKKKYKQDSVNHDFRITGDDIDKSTWMVSYWIAPPTSQMDGFFTAFVHDTFLKEPHDSYIAILDSGKEKYEIRQIIYLNKS